LIVYTSCDWGL